MIWTLIILACLLALYAIHRQLREWREVNETILEAEMLGDEFFEEAVSRSPGSIGDHLKEAA